MARAYDEHIIQLVELQTRAQQGPRERDNQDIFDKFRKMNPTEFHGDADPYVAEEWINSLEVIFDYMGIQDAEKIKRVDFMFKRELKMVGSFKDG